jgi:polyhydroxyalkanoate synthesis regulator phasin
MFELVRKSMLAGIGAFAMTEERMQDIINEFVQKGQISEKEGKYLFVEFQKAIDEQRTKMTEIVEQQVSTLLKELNLVTKNDLADMEKNLKKELTKIEKRLAKLEKQVKPPAEQTGS